MLKRLNQEFRDNLEINILPYWSKLEDPDGGYYGLCDWTEKIHKEAERGCILNARILWTYSAAARTTGHKKYEEAARREFRYFLDHFIDREYGGCYWSINSDGTPLDTKKQYYAIAFAIYALSEYYMLTQEEEALTEAIGLFKVIENHSRDHEGSGYFEASTREWQPISDMRLSDKDMNSEKTMNTHLHILEGYTNLLRVWRNEETKEATSTLLKLFNEVIIDKSNNHMGLFFDKNMKRVEQGVSYGHDIEASWLMLEAAQVIGDEKLLEETMNKTESLARASLEGLQPDGSMVYEMHDDGHLDSDRHWWVQAETIVGLLYLAHYHGDGEALEKASKTWDYIKTHLIDKSNGEWIWRSPGTPENITTDEAKAFYKDEKAGFWKCPYHNSRMCMEGIRQLKELQDQMS